METIFDYNQIKQIIPHRQPFLLIDKVVEYTKKVNVVWLLNKYQETNHSFRRAFS